MRSTVKGKRKREFRTKTMNNDLSNEQKSSEFPQRKELHLNMLEYLGGGESM